MVTPRPNPNEEPSSGGNVVISQPVDGSSSTVSSEQYIPSFTSPIRRIYGMPPEFMANLHNSSSTFGSSSTFRESPLSAFQPYQGLGPLTNQLSRPPGFGLSSQAIPTFTSSSVAVMRQQMDESNHEMVHMLTHQMGTILRPLIQDSTQSCQQMATQMT